MMGLAAGAGARAPVDPVPAPAHGVARRAAPDRTSRCGRPGASAPTPHGLDAVAADLSRLSGLAVPRALVLMAAVARGLSSIGLYSLLVRLFAPGPAAVIALCASLIAGLVETLTGTGDPAIFLGLGFALSAVGLLADGRSRSAAVAAGSFVGAALMTAPASAGVVLAAGGARRRPRMERWPLEEGGDCAAAGWRWRACRRRRRPHPSWPRDRGSLARMIRPDLSLAREESRARYSSWGDPSIPPDPPCYIVSHRSGEPAARAPVESRERWRDVLDDGRDLRRPAESSLPPRRPVAPSLRSAPPRRSSAIIAGVPELPSGARARQMRTRRIFKWAGAILALVLCGVRLRLGALLAGRHGHHPAVPVQRQGERRADARPPSTSPSRRWRSRRRTASR